MKLTPRDTPAFLKAPDRQAEAVLLYGPDAGLVRERSRGIAVSVLGEKADPLNRIELSGEQVKSDPAVLRDELSALSLMGGRRLVTLRDATDKTGAIVAGAFEGLTGGAYLIVEAGELSPSSPLRSLFEKESRFAALPCYRDDARALADTIRTTLAGFGLSIHRDALEFLTTHMGNDRGVTRSELEKIALYMGVEKEVTLGVAMALTGHNAAESMEDLCHAVACGEAAQAGALLVRLLHEGEQPVALVRALLRHFQRLDVLCVQAAHSDPEIAIGALKPKVFYKYVPLMKRQLNLWPARMIARAQNLLLRAERELKSGHSPPALCIGHAVQQAARMAG